MEIIVKCPDDLRGSKYICGEPIQEIVRCKDCIYFEFDHFYSWDGIQIITAHEICTKFGSGCKTKTDGFCNFGERRSE